MIFIRWFLLIVVFVCVFLLAKWLVPLLLGAIGVGVPEQIAAVIALLIALSFAWGGWSYWRPVAR